MDTIKMGAFIREQRKKRDMTQKVLADHLGLTDRAVSKWERGLNAPDISVLEPLAEVLGVTVTELIAGERAECREEEVRTVIAYSVEQTDWQKRQRRKYTAFMLGFTMMIAVMISSVLWFKGVFSIAHCSGSSNGEIKVTVYSRDVAEDFFSEERRITVRENYNGGGESTVIYGGTFGGLWWAPKGEQYVLTMETKDGSRTVLRRSGTVTEMDVWLRFAAGKEAFAAPGTGYHFCQWAEDGIHMLIRYVCEDGKTGYFWFDSESGTVVSVFALME